MAPFPSRRLALHFCGRIFTFADGAAHVAVSRIPVRLVGVLERLCVGGLLAGIRFTQALRPYRWLFLGVRFGGGSARFRGAASLFVLFALFLALFGPFVALPCFGVTVAVALGLAAFLGAPFSAPLLSFPVPAGAPGLLPLFTAQLSFSLSAVSFFASVPVAVCALSSQPVRLSVSASASAPAPIPAVPPVAVSGPRWSVVSEWVGRRLLSAPAPPPVARSLGPRRAPAAVAALPAVAVALRVPPVSAAASRAAVRGHVQVSVGLPELFPGISKYVQEIAVFPFGALLSVKQTWNHTHSGKC